MVSVAQAFALDEETEKHMQQAQQEERTAPPEPDRPEPSVSVEKQEPEQKAEKPALERTRNPDGTFAGKVEAKTEAPEKSAPKAPEKPAEVKPPEGYVPHGALHEERSRRKEMEKRVEAMEKRWEQIVARMQEKPAQPAQAPDPSQDFPGHVQHHFNQFANQQNELAKKVQGFESLTQQQQQEQQFMQAYTMAAQEFASKQNDFGPAYQHWLTNRLEELTEAGYTKEQALHIRNAEERGVVAKAFEDGVNPAERLYAVAKRRGYTAPSVEKPAEKQVEKPAVDPAEKLRSIEQGQRATPQMGGGTPKGKLTLQTIAAMSDEEFSSLDWEKTMRELTP